MTGDLRVLIADDHPVVRDGLVALLASVPGYDVVAQVGTGTDAVREAVLHTPDVALLDLQMPGLDGFGATMEIARVAPRVGVLVLTMHEDDDSVFAAMRAGARGYLVKGATQEEILGAITAVARGEAIFGPGVAQRVLALFAAGPTVAEPAFPELTRREHEILDLLAGGLGNAAIADRLSLAPKTVANNVSSIFVKLRVAGRPEAIVRAREAGLGRTRDGE
ncbi:MAG: response regulator [Nocardioidaceae bacterium]